MTLRPHLFEASVAWRPGYHPEQYDVLYEVVVVDRRRRGPIAVDRVGYRSRVVAWAELDPATPATGRLGNGWQDGWLRRVLVDVPEHGPTTARPIVPATFRAGHPAVPYGHPQPAASDAPDRQLGAVDEEQQP